MKQTAIRIGEDLLMRINRLKYNWGCKTQEDTIRKLIEICSKIDNAGAVSTEERAEGKTSLSGASSGGSSDSRKLKFVDEEKDYKKSLAEKDKRE